MAKHDLGLANLGYVVFVAGLLAGTFQIFGLCKRWHALMLGAAAFLPGTVLSNYGTVTR